MLSLTIENHEHATELDALGIFAKAFPTAGAYVVRTPGGAREITFSEPPARAEDPLTLWREVFPTAGEYLVAPMAKAEVGFTAAAFAEWWLERLVGELRTRTSSVRQVLQKAVEAYMQAHGGRGAASLEGFEALQTDLRAGVRFALGHRLPADLEARVRALGFTDQDVLDFAAIAYRMGMLDQELRKAAGVPWGDIVRAQAAAPTTAADEVGIQVARQEVARYLTPVLLRDGTAAHAGWLELERQLVQSLTVDAARLRLSARQLASQLFHQVQDEIGFTRDWERVARTELQRIRLMGAFATARQTQGWTDDTLVYRIVAANPCNACLRLYLTPEGKPRLYTVAALEEEERKGPNRGPVAEWGPRVGPTHPNCLCSPWVRYVAALERVWGERAASWRQILRERKLPVREAA